MSKLCHGVQTLGDSRAAEYMKGRKTLEINPDHPIIQALKDKVDSDAAGAKVWCIKKSCYMSVTGSTGGAPPGSTDYQLPVQ